MTEEATIRRVRSLGIPAFVWSAHTWGRSSCGYHLILAEPIQLWKEDMQIPGAVTRKDGRTTSEKVLEKLLRSFRRGWNLNLYFYKAPAEWLAKYPEAKEIYD